MLQNILSHSNYKGYGTEENNNPGFVDFEEEHLHAVDVSFSDQFRRSFEFLKISKTLGLILCVVLLAILVIDGNGSLPSLSTNAAVTFFFLSLIAVVPIGNWAIEYIEDIVVRTDSIALGIWVNVVVEHTSEVAFSIFALFMSQKRSLCYIKTIFIGTVLLNLLMMLGVGIVFSPVSEEHNFFGMNVWSSFSVGMKFTTIVFMFPTIYDYMIAIPDSQRNTNANTTAATIGCMGSSCKPSQVSSKQDLNLLFVSRGLCLCAFVVFGVYMYHVVKSKNNYYSSALNPNSPSSLAYALQFRARRQVVSGKKMDTFLGPRYSFTFAACGFVALQILQILLCGGIAYTLQTATRHSPFSLPFILVILIPLAFNWGSVVACWLFSKEGRLDISASIAFSSVVHLFMCIMPFVVCVAWVLGRPLNISYHPFLVCLCFLSVLIVSEVVSVKQVQWMLGAMLIALYGLLTCTCLLGGWHLCEGSLVPKKIA